MAVEVRRIAVSDETALTAVVQLGRRNARYLGFMPKGGYVDRAEKGTLLGAYSGDDLVGYLLYDLPRSVIHVAHLCVAADFRRQGIARSLIKQLAVRHPERRGVELFVRNDFPAFDMWYQLGFTPAREVAGRGAAGNPKTLMWLDYGEPDLFSWTEDPAVALTAVADASVFFDLHAQPGRAAHPATPELADAVASGELELLVVPELVREISRHDDPDTRRTLRSSCDRYRRVAASSERIDRLAREMAEAAANDPPQQLSERDLADLRYAAAAVIGGVRHLITKDDKFSKRADKTLSSYGLTALSPRAALVHLDEVARSASYSPRALLGTALERVRVGSRHVGQLRDVFLNREAGERRADFDRLVGDVLSSPNTLCETIATADGMLALWSARVDATDLVVELLRVDPRAPLAPSLAEQLEFMLRDEARRRGVSRVVIADPNVPRQFMAPLNRDGFVAAPGGLTASTPGRCQSRAAWARQLATDSITRSSPQLLPLRELCTQEREPTLAEAAHFEHLLWPAKMVDAPLPTYLVPIRQVWSSRLFGVPESLEVRPVVLGLSREHVYYRAPRPSGISAPARILWYATQGRREPVGPSVFACSRLEEVVNDAPEILHARFKHLGVYERHHVLEAARRGTAQALRVADTELFPRVVGLDELQRLAREACQTLHLRSPQRLKAELFGAIYRKGACVRG